MKNLNIALTIALIIATVTQGFAAQSSFTSYVQLAQSLIQSANTNTLGKARTNVSIAVNQMNAFIQVAESGAKDATKKKMLFNILNWSRIAAQSQQSSVPTYAYNRILLELDAVENLVKRGDYAGALKIAYQARSLTRAIAALLM